MSRSNLPVPRTSYGSSALTSTPSGAANASNSSASTPPLQFRSVIARKASPSFNLKVIKARMTRTGRKVEFDIKQQTFIEIVDATANVEHILGVVQRRWGSEYVLVTQDGLQLDDAPATQGMNYCICPLAIAS